MIVAGSSKEYVPCGRKHYLNQHPGNKILCETSKLTNEPSETSNLNIVKALKNVSLHEKNEKWMLRFHDSCEEELYAFKNTVIWSKGRTGDTKHVLKCFTIDNPVQEVLWASFQKSGSRPSFSKNDVYSDSDGDVISGVCIFDSYNLHVHLDSGQQFLSPFPFQMKKVWKMKFGLLIERVPSEQESQAQNKSYEQLPLIFSILHPLDEVAPVVKKVSPTSSSLPHKISFLNNQKQTIVFISDNDPAILLMHDRETGQHSIWKLRKALPEEYVVYENEDSCMLNNSAVGTPSGQNPGAASSSSIYSRFLLSGCASPSTAMSSFSPLKNTTTSSKLNSPSGCTIHSRMTSPGINNMAAISRSLSPSVSGNMRLSGMSPHQSGSTPTHLQHVMRSPFLSEGGSFILQSLNELQQPLTPDICLDLLWVEPLPSAPGNMMTNPASQAFISKDFNGQNFLCYLIENQNILRCVRFEESNDKRQLIFGTVTNIPAKAAIGLVDTSVVLDCHGNLVLYSGIVKMHNIFIPNPFSSMFNPCFSQNSPPYAGTPRRQSLITSSRPPSAMDARFDEDVHLLSPVPVEMDESEMMDKSSRNEGNNVSLLENTVSLRDGVVNSVTVEISGGNLLRVTLPELSSSTIVEMCLKTMQYILPRDLSLQFSVKWYCSRNAPGDKFTSLLQEWNFFVRFMMRMIGYDTDALFNSSSDLSVPCVEPKRFRTSCSGEDEDWEYLLKSSYHVENKFHNLNIINALVEEDVQETTSAPSSEKFNPDAPLFQHMPAILYAMHLIYEEMKLNMLLWKDNLHLLAVFLLQLSRDLRIKSYEDYYCRDFPDLYAANVNFESQINDDCVKSLQYPNYFSQRPPSVFGWVHSSLEGSPPDPFPCLIEINTNTRNIILLYGILSHDGDYHIQDFLQRILPPGQRSSSWLNLTDLLSNIQESKHTKHEKIVGFMTTLGFSKQDLINIPSGIALPLYNSIFQTRENPPSEWSSEAYSLIEREDLADFSKSDEKIDGTRKSVKPSYSHLSRKKVVFKQEDDTGMETLDHELLSLRFNKDMRVKEVCNLLQSSKPVTISIQQRPEVSDHDFIEEQERHLYGICIRTMALPVGRGMFALRTSRPIITEPLPIPKLCLSGKAPPRNSTVDLSHIDVPANMNLWPLFHNGVAAGLMISSTHSQIDSTWIVYNAPKGTNDNPIEHAGFLMALGLNGHLTNLARWNIHDYLAKAHEPTGVGLLLGIAAAKRGTMDMTCTKLLSIHVEAFLPATSVELNVPQIVQVAAVLGIGLVYEGTAHRHTAEVLLSEIGRLPGPEGENCMDRESYSLTSGLALGLVTFGRGSEIVGLSDLNIADMLHHYMVGGRRKTFNNICKDEFKSPSYQIKEGDCINTDVTSPGATLALGMMFFNTNNKSIADWMKAPDTQILLDSIRPDFLLLRTFSHGLILWSDVCPSTRWVESHLSEVVARYAFRRIFDPDNDIDYESMSQAYCNVIAGACLTLGMKFAGSANNQAFTTIMKYVKRFIQISLSSAVDLAGKMTIETCLCTTVLALAMVMAGTGDLQVMRICRYLRARIGQASSCALYGSHMASSMALGLLFLGGGRYTLGSSSSAISAMICAFFPKFPIHSNDNRNHLQAFRHLYVLAVEPRLILPRDIDSGLATYANIILEYKDTECYNGITFKTRAPCIIPQLHLLQKVTIKDDRYWPVVFEESKNWSSLKKLLNRDGVLYVKQKSGCLSYVEDPKGYKTLLAQGLTKNSSNTWSIKPNAIKAFTSDSIVWNFATYLLQPDYQDKEEGELLHTLRTALYECVTEEKTQVLSSYISTIFAVRNLETSKQAPQDVWQIKLALSFFDFLNKKKEENRKVWLINPEFILAIKNKVEQKMNNWLQSNRLHLRKYLQENLDTFPQMLALILILFDIPAPHEFPQITLNEFSTFVSFYLQMQEKGICLPTKTVIPIFEAFQGR